MKKIFIMTIVVMSVIYSQNNPDLQQLAREYFQWRTATQPVTPDDVPRVARTDGWVPDFSPAALRDYRQQYQQFRSALASIPQTGWTRSDSVDYLLLRSAIERVNWELNVLNLPGTHPEFYVQQTLGSVFDLLIISSTFTEQRIDNLIRRLNAVPGTLDAARGNLTDPVQPFARIALAELRDVKSKLQGMVVTLNAAFPNDRSEELESAAETAALALEAYSRWLQDKLPEMSGDFAIGWEAYLYFLKNIALVPYSPETLLQMGNQEWERAVSFETLEIVRNASIPPPEMMKTVDVEIDQARRDEIAIRVFLIRKNIFTIPEKMGHYTLRATPEYLKALGSFGELDDFTAPDRRAENAVRYIPEPSPQLGFFYRTVAVDPRPLTVHEGVPGHYFQLLQAWQNPDFIRRHYFDSNANEGIGFYLEEMLLQEGLFDDRPHTREIIYRFMRLRALRVAVDINLALGKFSIAAAGDYLASTVPMDRQSAFSEAAFFAATPGQAISYQIGKLQILKLISAARVKLGPDFGLKTYHDYMMVNGNVPIALQYWEYLGVTDEIKKLWD